MQFLPLLPILEQMSCRSVDKALRPVHVMLLSSKSIHYLSTIQTRVNSGRENIAPIFGKLNRFSANEAPPLLLFLLWFPHMTWLLSKDLNNVSRFAAVLIYWLLKE
jgi:hypothetical protein